ncbi:hypothetical protein GQ54DRAFT_196992 [Martensiomyces pterosporus]|nr:hypothetical protein GQ54DRAFT_196992 [Martensiomyces pterosporus]
MAGVPESPLLAKADCSAPIPLPTRPMRRRVVSASGIEQESVKKRLRLAGNKDLYHGHSDDVILAKSLIDPDQKCSITTVKAYVTHVCAWFRYCRTLDKPNYKLVNEEKLSGFLKWATETPRLPSKSSSKSGSASNTGSMSYQSARRYVEGGILALWRRYKQPGEENPLHALSYLSTKYAIREASAPKMARAQQERHYTAFAVTREQELSVVGKFFAMDPQVGIQAWAYHCLGAATWIPGTHRLHLRLSHMAITNKPCANVEESTIPMLEFKASPESVHHVGRFAEIGITRHTNPLLCPWYAIATMVFMQWSAQPSAATKASLHDLGTWLGQPLFQSCQPKGATSIFQSDEDRVQAVSHSISHANMAAYQASKLNYSPDIHLVRARDKIMAEPLGMSATQVVRLAKWRIHHRREGVSRAQAFFDLALVISGQSPLQGDCEEAAPSTSSSVSDAGSSVPGYMPPARTRVPVPDRLIDMVFPWLPKFSSSLETRGRASTFPSRPRSTSMAASSSAGGVKGKRGSGGNGKTEKLASLQVMREFARVLVQDTAALLIDPEYSDMIQSHPVFAAPVFHSPVFVQFCNYALHLIRPATPTCEALGGWAPGEPALQQQQRAYGGQQQILPKQQRPSQDPPSDSGLGSDILQDFPSMPSDAQFFGADALYTTATQSTNSATAPPLASCYQPRHSAATMPAMSELFPMPRMGMFPASRVASGYSTPQSDQRGSLLSSSTAVQQLPPPMPRHASVDTASQQQVPIAGGAGLMPATAPASVSGQPQSALPQPATSLFPPTIDQLLMADPSAAGMSQDMLNLVGYLASASSSNNGRQQMVPQNSASANSDKQQQQQQQAQMYSLYSDPVDLTDPSFSDPPMPTSGMSGFEQGAAVRPLRRHALTTPMPDEQQPLMPLDSSAWPANADAVTTNYLSSIQSALTGLIAIPARPSMAGYGLDQQQQQQQLLPPIPPLNRVQSYPTLQRTSALPPQPSQQQPQPQPQQQQPVTDYLLSNMSQQYT